MDAPLRRLCERVPDVIGTIVCDDEGETVVSALGSSRPPPGAETRARDHVPRSMALHMPEAEFLLRLAGAEACATLRALDRASRAAGEGPTRLVHCGYLEMDLLIRALPEDYDMLTMLRRPAVVGLALRWIEVAAGEVAHDILE